MFSYKTLSKFVDKSLSIMYPKSFRNRQVTVFKKQFGNLQKQPNKSYAIRTLWEILFIILIFILQYPPK